MTREEAKELMPIIKAFAEGKTIEIYDGEWNTIPFEAPHFDCAPSCYRIKQEPKYRPFKSQEDCWQEMLKHQPFGWVKSKDKGYFHLIGLVQFASELEDVMITFATSEQLARSSSSIYENYIFVDGTPFGIKEEVI